MKDRGRERLLLRWATGLAAVVGIFFGLYIGNDHFLGGAIIIGLSVVANHMICKIYSLRTYPLSVKIASFGIAYAVISYFASVA